MVAAATVASGASAQDDDLGTQPLVPPTGADLGMADDTAAADDDAPASQASPSAPVAPSVAMPSAPPVQAGPPKPPSEKAQAAIDALTVALHDLDDADPKAQLGRLEAAANAWVPDGAPAIKPLLRLLRARIALLQGRFDEADAQLRDASATLDSTAIEVKEARRLREAIRFFRAAVVEARARPKLFGEGCGRILGIRRLARDEDAARQAILEEVGTRYADAARGPDRFWARRAAFASARLSEDIARMALGTPNYRTVVMPPPYSIEDVDSAALVEPTLGAWFSGLRRAYGEILGAIDVRDPDPALADRVRAQAGALGKIETTTTTESVKNPWRKDFHPGLVRMARRAERAADDGHFVAIENAVAVAAMNEALARGIDTVDGAFALTGLATVAPETLSVDPIMMALSSSTERVVVAGMLAAERVVKGKNGAEKAAALREPLLAATATALKTLPEGTVPFSTLQASLYGPVERGLVALLSVGRADRAAIDVIVGAKDLPVVERAWLAAEFADSRLAPQYDAWGWEKDDHIAALAIWGGVTARGRKFSGYLLRPGDPGLVGCVSRSFD
jgi:hypothetical protein